MFALEEEIFANKGLSIRWGEFGRYLVAEKDFKEGDVLWSEVPLVSMQSLSNRREMDCCQRCLRALNTFEHQMRLAFESEDVPNFVYEKNEYLLCEPVSCACGMQYCSNACKKKDWNDSHILLCTGPIKSEDHPLIQFKKYAIQHNEVFLMAAQIYASIILQHVGRKSIDEDINEVAWPFSLFMRKPWSSCVVYLKDMDENAQTDKYVIEYSSPLSKEELKEQCFQCQKMLYDTFLSPEISGRVKGLSLDLLDPLFKILNVNFFEEIIGLFEINCSAISFYGPIQQMLVDSKISKEKRLELQSLMFQMTDVHAECDSHSEGEEVEDDIPEEITEETIEEIGERLPSFDGIGLFEKISVMNHSCVPNVVTCFESNWKASVEAVRDIKKGDEVTQSYIEHECTYEERRQILSLWGMNCQCAACKEKLDIVPPKQLHRKKL